MRHGNSIRKMYLYAAFGRVQIRLFAALVFSVFSAPVLAQHIPVHTAQWRLSFIESVEHQDLVGITCMRSSTILLFARNAENGRLRPDGLGKAEMVWPTSVTFSPDDKHLYVSDAGGNCTSQAQSSIVVFQFRQLEDSNTNPM